MSDVSTQAEGPEAAPSTGQEVPIEPLKDHFGNEADLHLDKYPDDSPAHKGTTTRPSGQGGASPKARPDYQDMWPANPPPSESARIKGEENDRIARGEVTEVELANERLADITGQTVEDQSNPEQPYSEPVVEETPEEPVY